MNTAFAELLHNPMLWRGDDLAQTIGTLSTGFADLDRELPGAGWPRGALTELLSDQKGIGELRLLVPALRRVAMEGGCIVLVAPPHVPCAPAFAGAGIDPRRVVVIAAAEEKQRWWAAEQVLRAGCVGALLFWPKNVPDQRLRRLQLAAQDSESAAFVLTGIARAAQASPAPLRLRLSAEVTATRAWLEVDVLKRRGGVLSRPVRLDVTAARGPATLLPLTPSPEVVPLFRRVERVPLTRAPAWHRRHAVEAPQARIWNHALARADEVRRVPPPDPRGVQASRIDRPAAIPASPAVILR